MIFVAALLAALASSVAQADDLKVSDLMACYQMIKPFTLGGVHATVYPSEQNIAVLPGKFSGKDGVFVYGDAGASFVAISDTYSSKTIAFDIDQGKGRVQVIYQPGTGGRKNQAWVRVAIAPVGTLGITSVFRNSDGSDKRAPLVSELDSMIQFMAKTWDSREDQLVQAVEQGKYLWVEVDVDHYKDALKKCEKRVGDFSETSSLKTSIEAQSTEFNSRASRSGTVRDDVNKPSSFQGAPQY